MVKKVYLIGIGGIGVSALARYYLANNYEVYGSDLSDSEIIKSLKNEGMNIIIGKDEKRINTEFDIVVYTEAIPITQEELKKSKELGIKTLSYPKALGEVANKEKLIAISGTHGKSTTTSLISIILKNSQENFTSIVGTLLKEFNNKNFYTRNNGSEIGVGKNYFAIEACEYKRSFLAYKSTVGIITNIEIDHLDYYKDLDDYLSAFESFLNNIKVGGFAILNGQDKNCQKLFGKRKDINYINIFDKYFELNNKQIKFPKLELKVPGEHILYDAKIAYCLGYLVGIKEDKIKETLSVYNGVWRRNEELGHTQNNNLVISDYGHHPTEIKLTLKSIKGKYIDKKILTIFQPHQYNRTLELLDQFIDSFSSTDLLIIPNIYESRDSEEDKQKINPKKLVSLINHNNKYDGEGMKNTLKLIKDFDKKYKDNLVIILLGAGNVDDLRYEIDLVK